MMSGELKVGQPNDFHVYGFHDIRRTDRTTFLNAATTATWAIHTAADQGGSSVASGSMTYVASSNGEYVGGPDASVSLTAGTEYWITIVLIEGSVKWSVNAPYTAVRRTGKTPGG